MFDFLSWGHLLVIALAAFFIFGPERLPTLARDAARGLQRARAAMTTVREQLGDELGADFAGLREVDVRRYHPGIVLRDHLLGVDDRPAPGLGRAGAPDSAGPAAAAPARDRTLPPQFDADAT